MVSLTPLSIIRGYVIKLHAVNVSVHTTSRKTTSRNPDYLWLNSLSDRLVLPIVRFWPQSLCPAIRKTLFESENSGTMGFNKTEVHFRLIINERLTQCSVTFSPHNKPRFWPRIELRFALDENYLPAYLFLTTTRSPGLIGSLIGA